jgi:arginine deiminase
VGNSKKVPLPCGCIEPHVGDLFLASEADRLRACVVHAPGREIERLIPANYRWHLYDDLLHLEEARREHAVLRTLLERVGARVHELGDLLARVYEQMSSTDREQFLTSVHDVSPGAPSYVLRQLAEEPDPAVVARALIEGVEATRCFAAEVEDALYHLQPMANLIFMQDVAVVLLDRVVQGYMSQLVRMPEEVVVETVIRRSNVFGPLGSGEFWIDPSFRARHRMRRTAWEYVQLDAARVRVRIGGVEAPWIEAQGSPQRADGERVHIELEGAYMADGRHFILEGGNVLTMRRADGKTVVILGHNARTSADAIDELAYRLLRHDGRPLRGEIGAVIVVDVPDSREDPTHLDTRLLVLDHRTIVADRTLVQPTSGPGARFFVFLPDVAGAPRKRRAVGEEFRPSPKVDLITCSDFEDATTRAGLDVTVRWVPGKVPWETPDGGGGEAWIALQQSLWAHALNLLVIDEGIFVGFDRHAAFYREVLGAVCVDAEREVLAGAMSGLRCCALLAALRARGGGAPVALLIPGAELSRARGGARSLAMPLMREPRGKS